MELTLEIVKKHYRRSERAVKRCERIALAVLTPAINQLRYAGNHVLKAVTASAESERMEELRKAEFHCQRAWYDAMDSVVLFNLVLSACGLLTTQCLWAVVIGWAGVVLCLVLSVISSVMLFNTFRNVGDMTSWRASRP